MPAPLALSDNATAVVLALIGLVGVIVPVSITAWVGLKLHKLAPQVLANTQAVAVMKPQVEEVVREVVLPEEPDRVNLAKRVEAIDNSVNNKERAEDPTLRQTAEATGAAVVRIEAEQVRIEAESRTQDTEPS